MNMILAGDIGGTETVLTLFQESQGGLQRMHDATYVSGEYPSLESILLQFLAGKSHGPLRAGCFGVAGPVINGTCVTTNLPWTIDESTLANTTGIPCIKLVNDLEAAAYGMLHLSPDEFRVLNPGTHPASQGNIAVIAAGTGLGEAILYWDGTQFHAIATEGGHTDFASRTPQEIALFDYLHERYGGHVSYERVLSGPGLYNVYAFLRHCEGVEEPAWLTEELKRSDPSPTLSQMGLTGQEPLCQAALELFATIYGAEAGNLALKCMSVGGVLVGGGIAPKILPVMQNGSFMRGFTSKGRLAPLLESLEVRVALNLEAPVLGAAHVAVCL